MLKSVCNISVGCSRSLCRFGGYDLFSPWKSSVRSGPEDVEITHGVLPWDCSHPGEDSSVQYSHNGRDGVSIHRCLGCLFCFVLAQIKENTKASHHWPLWGEFTGDFPHKGPVTQKMFPFDDVIMLIIVGLFAVQWNPCKSYKIKASNISYVFCCIYSWYKRCTCCQAYFLVSLRRSLHSETRCSFGHP